MGTRRVIKLIIVVFLITVVTCLSSPQMPVSAFSLDVHKAILYLALPQGISNPTDVDQGAMVDIVGSFWLGVGNLGSDVHQSDMFRHFDNAASPKDICVRASEAWSTFIHTIDSGAKISHDPNFFYDTMLYPTEARRAFGELTHALQDFYSHSNWIELGFRTEAPLFPVCFPTALPPDLQTGYFVMSEDNGFYGCPKVGPPEPFKYCHYGRSAQLKKYELNKDEPDFGHGAEIIPGSGGMTYHQVAMELAADHTKHLYDLIRLRIQASVIALTDDVSGDCVARLLFQSSPSISCLDLSGSWKVTDADTNPSGGSLLGAVLSLTQQDPFSLVGQIFASCDTLPLAVTRNSKLPVFSGTVTSCPAMNPGPCPVRQQLPLALSYVGKGRIKGQYTLIDLGWDTSRNTCVEMGRHLTSFELRRSP